MDFVTRRDTAYRDLVLMGVTVKRLARSHWSNERWFVECEHESWCNKEQAKQLIADYVRHEWGGHAVAYSQRMNSPKRSFVCSFYSDAL